MCEIGNFTKGHQRSEEMGNNGNIPPNLPIFYGKNWDRWCAKMRVIFNFQECNEVVDGGYEPLGENPTNAQRETHKETKKSESVVLHTSVCECRGV